MLILAAPLLAAAACRASNSVALDASYASDHQNYLCMNYTRPVPLPCAKARRAWKPRWLDKAGRPRFVITAWWPPAQEDIGAFADAGFNMAMLENILGGYCTRRGPNATITHDDLFEVAIATSDELARRGILTVFETGNMCNAWMDRAPTVAYGNATGGILESATNITARGHPGQPPPAGKRLWSQGQTVPELEYVTRELERRGKLEQFAGVFVHDDTVVEDGSIIAAVEWLKEHAPTFVPFVNQVGGTSAPQSLYRTGLFISAPEQYPIKCPDGDCTKSNQTANAIAQMDANAGNALVDARFGLDSWPLFQLGSGNGPLDGGDPDNNTINVRSDSLVRFMAYSAVAYGATALNYYCWGKP